MNDTHISFEVPDAADDIKLICILGAALKMYEHVPLRDLQAALSWFSAYSSSTLAKIAANPQPSDVDHG